MKDSAFSAIGEVPPARQASLLWNLQMMKDSRDFPSGKPTTSRYAILSVPRSGSTLMARALRQTGQAGDPHEYLNPNAISAWSTLQGKPPSSAGAYLAAIETRRTAPNGRFGIKIHYSHLLRLAAKPADFTPIAADFLKLEDRLILIYRTDRIAQAVSYYVAQTTGLWTSEHGNYLADRQACPLVFDALAITRCLAHIVEGEQGWRNLLERLQLPCLEVTYEGLTTAYQDTLGRVFRYIGIDSPTAIENPAVTPTTHPQAFDLVAQFRAYLGCASPVLLARPVSALQD